MSLNTKSFHPARGPKAAGGAVERLDVTPSKTGFAWNTGRAEAAAASVAICTLAEGSHFCGVAALINSLTRANLSGDIVVGYRGALPKWFEALEPDTASDARVVVPGVRLHAVEIAAGWHLANLKARFILDTMEKTCPKAEFIYYFDPDIVIDCEWHVLAGWTRHGAVLVLDISNSFMSPQHVYRRAWESLAESRGYTCREITGYVNSGCVGVARRHLALVSVWADLMDVLAEEGFDMGRLKYLSGGPPEFAAMDQDVLNAAIMASRVPLALLGCESMGVYPRRGNIMPHAMFDKKPWVRPYIIDALRGFPPGWSHLAYWRYVDGPIRPFGPLTLARKRLIVNIARLIGLIHVRNPRDL